MSFRSLTLLAIAGLTVTAAGADDSSTASNAELRKRLDELDQRLRVLDRKAELAAEEAAAKAKTAVVAKAGEDGFSIGTADGAYRLKLGVLVQGDGRFWIDDETPKNNNTFLIRRGILTADAQLGKYTRGYLQTNFTGNAATSPASSNPTLLEAWVEVKPVDAVGVKVGRYKTLGLEYTNSTSGLTFAERGLPTNLVPQYDLGVTTGGAVGKIASWSLGVVNGAADGTVNDSDNGDGKDGVAKFGLTPFKGGGGAFDGLAVGVGASLGDEQGVAGTSRLGSYKSPGQATIFSYAANVYASGQRTRFAPYLEWYVDSFGLLAEYASSAQEVRKTGVAGSATLTNTAWQVVGSYVLTGEKKTSGGVVPAKAFSPDGSSWGAWEVAARVGAIEFDDEAFANANRYAGSSVSVSKATSYGVGVNWWLSKNLKWQLSGDYTTFADGSSTASGSTDRTDEKVIVTRFQINY